MVACVSCAGLGERRQEARAHYKLGVSHLNGGRMQAAFVEFQMSLKLNAKDKETHIALGIVYINLSDLEKAARQFRRAVALDPGYSEAHNNLCFVYYEMKEWNKAIGSCGRALENKLYRTPEKSYYNLGRSYYRIQEYSKAKEAFANAIRRLPNQPEVYYALALVYNAEKLYGKASEAMTTAIKLDPRFRGDIDKAEIEFMKKAEGAEDTRDLEDFIDIIHY
jgi:Tfp pilus assembly protein PilF